MKNQRLMTVTTLLAVSLHVLLGCCWHHPHLRCSADGVWYADHSTVASCSPEMSGDLRTSPPDACCHADPRGERFVAAYAAETDSAKAKRSVACAAAGWEASLGTRSAVPNHGVPCPQECEGDSCDFFFLPNDLALEYSLDSPNVLPMFGGLRDEQAAPRRSATAGVSGVPGSEGLARNYADRLHARKQVWLI